VVSGKPIAADFGTNSREDAGWKRRWTSANWLAMLPMTLQFLVAMIAAAINDRA
jgi:hypothetical protein